MFESLIAEAAGKARKHTNKAEGNTFATAMARARGCAEANRWGRLLTCYRWPHRSCTATTRLNANLGHVARGSSNLTGNFLHLSFSLIESMFQEETTAIYYYKAKLQCKYTAVEQCRSATISWLRFVCRHFLHSDNLRSFMLTGQQGVHLNRAKLSGNDKTSFQVMFH
jgi:hypothetical protein